MPNLAVEFGGTNFSAVAGAMGGEGAHFNAAVESTDQEVVYQSVRYGTKGYRLEVPNGLYRVTLKFNEPFYGEAGRRRFGATVQGESVVNRLDLFAKTGKNREWDLP